MIYIGKVKPSLMNEPIDKSVLEFFKNYQPLELDVPGNEEEQKRIKTSILQGFISGEMKALVRNNVNLISRDCLILDLDDVVISEDELIKIIHEKFNKFQYVLYPSISHGIKGVRYRLVLPLDGSVNELEYKLLVHYANNMMLKGIIGKSDDSNATWSQIMLLPTITQYTNSENLIINESEKQLPTFQLLDGAATWSKQNKPQSQGYINPSRFKRGGHRYRNATTELFESLVVGCGEGNRNNRISQITGGLLARAVDVEFAYKLVLVANEHFNDPLPIDEVNSTFESIARKELRAD
ncbi:primase alpha helix C-terminal domain-containing protein [Vagococcus carniphilus]|uniref:primase alpha helix C-terminal domain-containing protein n=1 Tax=Vagococcus carniphilus TaxID=218144 RepID=UPI00288C893E|nr:primase alpha helix C-terminal domain-containing protein [Vagococcus carniphilus]MDT2849725.1 primase alpha helix C-terminal domain-containing protein [Vagococcus carniphilus]